MSKLLFASLALAVLTLPVHAQSINVDIQPAGSSFGIPSPGYGGSAQSPGVWNGISSLTATNLAGLDGTPTSAGFSISSGQPGCPTRFWAVDQAGTSGEDEALLDDGHSPEDTGCSYVFSGLEPGIYTIDTIVKSPSQSCLSGNLQVIVQGSPSASQYLGGGWSGAYVQGSTTNSSATYGANFTRHTLTVASGTITIYIEIATTIIDYIQVVGIQLEKLDDAFTLQCYGDGSAAPCPCGNSGDPGQGCQNSTGVRGAFLYASGTTSPDTVVLHASGEMPTALTIFLQGNATVGPLVFGDGLRCAGGILKRLYVKSASGGVVSAPGPGDPSITARSAALGDPIPAGERRYYQTYYRDSNPTFCPAPTGNTFNASSAVKIVW